MPTFKLDDREIAFLPNDTIIRAAERAGIDIPHYCYHPGLSVAANCRMCLVELLPAPGRKPLLLDVLRWDDAARAYQVEKKPKLVPACQQIVSEGMEVRSDTSENVRQARHAVQEFLLLNHPVDCPICDQAGECRLQDYWEQHQGTKKRMLDEPIHKPKAVVFGPTIVYDAERCIACTRCVRFCDEVARDPVLSLRERGNRTEITVSPGRQLDHNYTLMTEFVCPVGALTARDFRFKARVWFLRSRATICQGCATGCHSFTDYDPRNQQVYRTRPRTNLEVNRYWMCDQGMLDYRRLITDRLSEARLAGRSVSFEQALDRAIAELCQVQPNRLAVVLGAEYSLEDNQALLWLARRLNVLAYFESGRPDQQADGVLMVADRNANSRGIRELLEGEPGQMGDLEEGLAQGRFTHVLALGTTAREPEQAANAVKKPGTWVVLGARPGVFEARADVLLPVAGPLECDGGTLNQAGKLGVSERVVLPLGEVRPAHRVMAALIAGLGFGTPFSDLSELRRSPALRRFFENPTETMKEAESA